MTRDQQISIYKSLEAIDPAENEETLTEEGVREIARILARQNGSASQQLQDLRDRNQIRIVTTQQGGNLDERSPMPRALFKWSINHQQNLRTLPPI
jgi:hypothetical protein